MVANLCPTRGPDGTTLPGKLKTILPPLLYPQDLCCQMLLLRSMLALRNRVSMKPIRQCHIVLYRRRDETRWTIRHGWIPTDDAESFRRYFANLPDCDESYGLASEPVNNTLQMFGEIRSDFENKTDVLTTSNRLAERKAVTDQLPRRNKTRVKAEDSAEAEVREQFQHITKAG
jgi:hypothetical protein